MASPHRDRLAALLPVPPRPIEAPTEAAWGELEERLAIELPSDYREFLGLYGSGVIDQFLWVLNPFASNGNARFPEASDRQLGILRWIREQGAETLPYPLYPEAGGLPLWAESAIGDCFYWITSEGSPDDWPVTVNEARADNWHDHPGPMTALLADLLDKTVSVDFFPHNFPTPAPSFTVE